MPSNLEASTSLTSWLQHLSILMPPKGAVVVGAGGGGWLKVLSALQVEFVDCIESDEKQANYLLPLLDAKPGWRLHQALVWSEDRKLIYHNASNPAESGVIPPETLATIWPNLTTRSREPRQSVTLQSLLANCPAEQQPNWLIIDCLPAQPILQGLGEQYAYFDVIIVRCLAGSLSTTKTNESGQVDSYSPTADVSMSAQDLSVAAKISPSVGPISGLSRQELECMLVPNGYRCLIAAPERQPKIVSALYMRDWKAMHVATQVTLNAKLEERQLYLDDMAQHNQQLQHENADSAARQRLLNDEIKNAHAKLDAFAKSLTKVTQENTASAVQLEESVELAATRQTQFDEIEQSQAQQAKDQAAMEVRLQESVKLAADLQNKINELQQQNQSLQSSVTDSATRQQLMQEEMARAEAQLDLIKEMLLADPEK